MKSTSFVYATTPDADTALKLAHSTIKSGLAACCNIIPGMTSVYEWKGQVHEDQEVVMVFKTTEEMIPDLTAFITTRHPSDNPCVVALPLAGGSQKFLDWIESQVKDRRS